MKANQTLGKMEVDGKTAVFRTPKMGDAKDLMELINGFVDEGARVLLTKKMTLKEEMKWLEGTIENMKKGTVIHVVVEIGGKVVGSGNISKRIPPPSAVDHVAGIGFGVSRDFRRKGIVERMARLLMEIGRKEWGLEIVKSSYMSDNVASAKLHKKLGFKEVGRIPKGAKYKGKYLDEIIMMKEL